MARRTLRESDLGNLQAFGVSQRDLNELERSMNLRKKVEIDEVKEGGHTVSYIFVDDKQVMKFEGY